MARMDHLEPWGFGITVEGDTLFLKTFISSRVRAVFMGMWSVQQHRFLCSEDTMFANCSVKFLIHL